MALSGVFEDRKEGNNSADDANDPYEEAQHSPSDGKHPVPLGSCSLRQLAAGRSLQEVNG